MSAYSEQGRMRWEASGAGGDKVTPAPRSAERLGRRLPRSRPPGGIQPGLSAALVNAALSLMLCQAPLRSGRLRAFAFSLMQAAPPESVLYREKPLCLIDQQVRQDPCASSDCHEKLQLL